MILIFWCFGIILVQFEQQVCHSWNNVSMHLFIDWSQFWGFYRSMLQIWQHWLHSCSVCSNSSTTQLSVSLYIASDHCCIFQLFDDLRTVQWTNVFMHFYSGIVKEWHSSLKGEIPEKKCLQQSVNGFFHQNIYRFWKALTQNLWLGAFWVNPTKCC